MNRRLAVIPCILMSISAVAGCGGGQPSTPAAAGTGPAATGTGPAATGSTSAGGGGGYFGALANARAKAQELEAINNLKQLAIAFHNFHDTFGHFPTQTGDPELPSKLSWRVELLPFLEESALHQQFKRDEPWDSPHNKKVLDTMPMPKLYRDPRYQPKEEKTNLTYFQGVAGDGGILSQKGGATLGAITNANGTAQTLMIVEAGNACPWTKPDDYVHDQKKPLPPLGGPKPGEYFLAAFADGHVQRIPMKTDEKTLRCMLQWTNATPFVLPKP
jgi:hypothetical protein